MKKKAAANQAGERSPNPATSQEEIDALKERMTALALSGRGLEVEAELAAAGKQWLIFSVAGKLGRAERTARVHEEKGDLAAARQALIDCAPAIGRAAKDASEGPMGLDYALGWLSHLSEIRFPQEAFDGLLAFAGVDLVRSAYAEKANSQDAAERALDWAPVFKSLPGFPERFVQEAEKAWPDRGDCPYPLRWAVGVAQLGDPDLIERCWIEGERLGLDMGQVSTQGRETRPGWDPLPGEDPGPLGMALMALDADCVKAIARFCPEGALSREIKALRSTHFEMRSSRDRRRLAEITALAEAVELGMAAAPGPRATTEQSGPRL